MDAARRSGDHVATATCVEPTGCVAESNLRHMLSALRPLGDASAISRHAASCPRCFAKVRDLFLATLPPESDPVHRIFDGVNGALYRLAKSTLKTSDDRALAAFAFDEVPEEVDATAAAALDRLDALDEYTEGRTHRSQDTTQLLGLIKAAQQRNRPGPALTENLLQSSIAIGGRYGLDAANLLGYLRFLRGDYEGAELLFNTVLEHPAADAYEQETHAHTMNSLAGVYANRGDLKNAILWCERSLMLKERLGLDARANYMNLVVFWLDHKTPYARDRVRHFVRTLLQAEGGKEWLESTLRSPGYENALARFRELELDREFPEAAT